MDQQIDVNDMLISVLGEHEKKIDTIATRIETIVQRLENEKQLKLNLDFLFRHIPQMEAQ